MFSYLLLAAALAATGGVIGAPSPADIAEQLRTVPAQADRANKILVDDTDVSISSLPQSCMPTHHELDQFVFNFLNATAGKGTGGEAIPATVSNFPVLVNNGTRASRSSPPVHQS